MKKAQLQTDKKTIDAPVKVEWPRAGRVSRGRQPQNRRILSVDLSETESVLVWVRENSFYRANERVTVDRLADGSYVDVKPKTSPLLRGGQE